MVCLSLGTYEEAYTGRVLEKRKHHNVIGIVDYGLGNLASVAGAIEYLDFEPVITSDPETLCQCSKIILPGVGAFGDGMENLRARGLLQPLNYIALEKKKPILGICLGFQLIARNSPEFGSHAGLGWFDTDVVSLNPLVGNLNVPHVGWNEVKQCADCILFKGIPDSALFYFVHSFALEPSDKEGIMGTCHYGIDFPAVIQKNNIFATQFHPEKSQRYGLLLLKNFLELSAC